MEQNYILAIDTSTEHLGVAVTHVNGEEIASYNDIAYRNLSDDLHPAIAKVMEEAGIQYQELLLVATTRGPGSFTSIRVGLTAAKGIVFTLDIPIVSVTSLEAYAYSYQKENSKETLSVWVEAHGGNIYTQSFSAESPIDEAISIKSVEAGKLLNDANALIGNAVPKHIDDIPQNINRPEGYVYINPSDLARLALERYNAKTSDINNTTALYIHPLNYNKTYNKDGTKK